MGYTTDFEGAFDISPRLTQRDRSWLYRFGSYRHGHEEGPAVPGIWCDWAPSPDGRQLGWNGKEKFYSYVEWLEYLIEEFFVPRGYELNGSVTYYGEAPHAQDVGRILITANRVERQRATLTYGEEK